MNLRTILIAVAAIVAMVGAVGCNPLGSTASASFKDCAECPDMVRVPAGEFTMGSPASEPFRGFEVEHPVKIEKPFALSKYEVTFDEWDACVKDGGCDGPAPDDQGWGRGKRPVIDVTWDEAKSYVEWLSKKTGKKYRLPSESEWEYAARAGTKTAFSYGPTISSAQANYDGSTAYGDGPVGMNRMQTTEVGSFPPNAFGLYDMHGNVWEWLEDCFQDGYEGAPANGAPFMTPECGGHVLRGGSWEDHPAELRSASRVGSSRDEQSWSDGFRVALSME